MADRSSGEAVALKGARALFRRLVGPRLLLGVGLASGALVPVAEAARYVNHGYQRCHPVRSSLTAADQERAVRLLPGLTELTFPVADGSHLHAWYTPPKNGNVMVMVTGLGGNRASLLDEAAVFARHGYGSLLLDERAHGDSDGNVATWGDLESSDVSRAVAEAYAQPGVTGVGALGFSVGGSAVALAAARDPRIQVVVLYATWTSLREEILFKDDDRSMAAFFTALGYRISGVHVDDVHPETLIARIAPRPLLMVSGGEDSDTPPWVMERLFAAGKSPKELWRVPNAGHGGYFRAAPETYEQRVIGFLDRSFSKH